MAAIIRPVQRQVVTQASTPVAVRPGQTAVGELGRGLADVGTMFNEWQDGIDTAAATNADAEMSDRIRDMLYADGDGFMYSQGGDAVSRRGDVSSALEELQRDVTADLNPAARLKANSSINARYQRALQTIDQHTSGQRTAYMDNAANARIQTSLNDAIYDPTLVNQSININRTEILDMAERNGWAPEVTELKLKESRTGIYSGIVTRLSEVDPIAALRYLKDNQDQMSGDEVSRLTNALTPMAKAMEGRNLGASAFQGATVAPDGWDWSNYLVGGAAARTDSMVNMEPELSGALANMFNNAPPEIQSQLRVTSGFRSNDTQQRLWNDAVAKYGSEAAARRWVAPPGKSQHNFGNAADLKYLSEDARQWAHANAEKYGLTFPLSNEDWHIEVAGARDGTAPTPKGSMSELLAIEDPVVRDAAISEYNLRATLATQEAESGRQAVQDAAFKFMEDGGNIDDLPVGIRQSISLEGMSSLRAYQTKLGQVDSDPQFYVDLMQQYSVDPDGFMMQDPMTWADRLDKADFDQMVGLRSNLIQGKAAPGNPSITALRSAASSALDAAGLGGNKDKVLTARAAFETDLLRWSSSFQTDNGRQPNSIELIDEINNMLVPIVINPRGAFNEQDAFAFQIDYAGDPLDPNDDLTADMIRDGRLKINDAEVATETIEVFAQGFMDRFGVSPTVQQVVDGLVALELYK